MKGRLLPWTCVALALSSFAACNQHIKSHSHRGWTLPAHSTDDPLLVVYQGTGVSATDMGYETVIISPIGQLETGTGMGGEFPPQWTIRGGKAKLDGPLAPSTTDGTKTSKAQLDRGYYDTATLSTQSRPWSKVCLAGTPEDWVYVERKISKSKRQGFWTDPAKLGRLPWKSQ